MDGVSAASGVFAVVSLAVQLLDTIQEIRQFVHKVTDASRQQQSLVTQLSSLRSLLEAVKAIHDRDACNGSTVFSESIRCAVLNCDDKLKPLQRYVQNQRSVLHGKTKFTKTVRAVKFAFNDKDIKEFNDSLYHAIIMLNAALALDSSDSQYRSSNNIMSMTCTIFNELSLLRRDILSGKQVIEPNTEADEHQDDAEAHKNKSVYSIKASRRRSVIKTGYKSFLGSLLVRKVETTTSFGGDHGHRQHPAHTQTSTQWLILPSFLSRYIDFEFQSISTPISRNLRVYNVIDDKDPIWRICYDESGRMLRSYLENNRDRIDPYVVDSYGYSLFHAATVTKNHDTCKALLELGVDPTAVRNEDGNDALHRLDPYSHAYPEKGIVPELTFRLIVAHFPDCVTGTVLGFWDTMRIEVFEIIIETWVTPENINLFDDSPILCAMRSMTRGTRDLYWPEKSRWIKSIQRLIKMGADIHRFSAASKVSLLHEVLAFANVPCDVPEAFHFWILILASSGVHTARYLEREVDFYYANGPIFMENDHEYRLVLTLDVPDEGDPRFGWEWWTDPHSPGYELANEFMYFDHPECFRMSKDFDCRRDYEDYDLYTKRREDHERYQRLREERFWSKKAAKAAAKAKKEEYERPIKLPGAWID